MENSELIPTPPIIPLGWSEVEKRLAGIYLIRLERRHHERAENGNEELSRYLDELPDLLTGDADGPDGRFPDGTVYDYEDALQATVETAPDGNRYVVGYQKGKGLVRIKELGVGVARQLISERRAG